ncbi:MAG: cytochrome C oxidase subunit IV family protein [Armatimonadota bacterium]|nr:cytochrome C oxidase subunit IV family protein [Armatimonadota bacterium]
MDETRKRAQLRLGLWVFIALIILTVVELWIAFAVPRPLLYLVVINLADAWLIMEYFMHLSRMWRAEE